jgi:subtilase family serine protease
VIIAALVGATASKAATPTANPINAKPLIGGEATLVPGTTNKFNCQARPIDASQGLRCYSPQQIQQAYGYTPLLNKGIDGTGRTIVIIDAYSNPYIQSDLALEDQEFGLPAANLQILPSTTAFDPTDPNQVGWAEEITLDVEWAHVMAPGANIILAEAASNNDADLLATTKYVIDNNLGDVISQSYGEAEQCMDPTLLAEQHQLFAEAVRKGITVFASSGDSGASQFNCDGTAAILAASTPASDPNVTGVGGTTLNATDDKTTPNLPTGTYVGETAWTEVLGCNPPAVDPSDVNCSGGGFSTVYSRPSWQPFSPQAKGHAREMRGVPDVSYNAGVNGGVLTVCSVCTGGTPAVFLFGGTSAGSPQWAALAADADQLGHHRMGNINPALYGIAGQPQLYKAAFHDVKNGTNDVAEIGGQGYKAQPGWDPVTGLGTPNAQALLPALAVATLFN